MARPQGNGSQKRELRSYLPAIPPKRLRLWVGPFADARTYRETADQTVQQLKALCRLKNDACVLDVGCGCGRVATSLTSFLGRHARYEGFDVAPPLLDWCVRNITAKFPNFRFRWCDIFNGGWNPDGRQCASQFRFPYPSSHFDVVWANSVFTHMLPADTERFISEIGHVLKPGSKCLLSFFLLNARSRKLIAARKSLITFGHPSRGCWLWKANQPEAAVAYTETAIIRLLARHHLNLDRPVVYGSWPARRSYLFTQDVIVARKR
jgi:SAM-dependent methyltransferase